jgi:hypothetical protein
MIFFLQGSRAGIFKQSLGARNRVGIGLSNRAARQHRLSELIPGLHKRLKIRAQGGVTGGWDINHTAAPLGPASPCISHLYTVKNFC